MERLISELMKSDMKVKSVPAQFGNEKGTSIQHYLIKMIHRILTVLDNNSRRETFAVVANLIDWNSAFPRQCPELGIESFIQNGVRASLIPTLIITSRIGTCQSNGMGTKLCLEKSMEADLKVPHLVS